MLIKENKISPQIIYRVFKYLSIIGYILVMYVSNGYSAPVHSQISKSELQRVLHSAVRRYRVPGIAAAILNGKDLMKVSSGLRVRGKSARITEKDSFALGSCFKAITSTVVARLVDRGIIHWETTIAEVFPELQATTNPLLSSATIEQLLSHRAGIVDDDTDRELYKRTLLLKGTSSEVRHKILPELLAQNFVSNVGKFQYSNIGVTVAAAMIEKVTAKSFDDILKETVTEPLGMKHVTIGAPGNDNPNDTSNPRGHDDNGRPLTNSQEIAFSGLPLLLAPAGLYSMPLDAWAKFAKVNMYNKDKNGAQFLTPETLTRVQSPVGPNEISLFPALTSSGYGHGWVTGKIGGKDVLIHDGSDNAWLSLITIFPKEHLSFMIVTNQLFMKSRPIGDEAVNFVQRFLLRSLAKFK